MVTVLAALQSHDPFMSKNGNRLLIYAAGTAAAATLAWAGYATTEWLRYGHASGATDNPYLDRILPRFEVAELHEIAVASPAATTYDTAYHLDMRRSRIVRAIFRGRELLMRSRAPRRRAQQEFLQEMLSLGWGLLAEEPGRLLVLGAVTKPWEANVKFVALPPDQFAAFNEPGYAKIVWTLEVRPVTESSSLFRTETRVATTDAESRKRFRRYWSMMSPGIRLIRRTALQLVKAEAERSRTGMGSEL
jgi:hypothetical protein